VTGRALGAALILAAVIAYLPVGNAKFILDDDLLLTANAQLQSAYGLGQIWLGKDTCDYTPLTLTSFWLEKRLWGDAPAGYHLTNLLLHAAAAVLLWRILIILEIPGAWLAACLFAIHPVNVASVAWIAERKNTLSAIFFFGSIVAFVTAHKRSANKWLFVSIALFLLAGLSKGAVVTLPLVLAGCIFWIERKLVRRDLLRLAPFFAVAAIISWLTIRYQAVATDYSLAGFDLTSRLARAGCVPWFYLRELFFPIGLSPMSPLFRPDFRSPLTYLSPILILAAMGLFLWKSRTWGRPLLFASSYYLWMLLPVLGLVWMAFQQDASCADWWQYLAGPGIFALIAAGIVTIHCASGTSVRLYLHVLVCLTMMLLLVQTWRRCAIYESMESYCRAILAENPRAWSLQNNLGIILKQRGELDEAAKCYRRALSENPRFMKAHYNLGNVFGVQSRLDEAEREFEAAHQLQPSNAGVLGNLSEIYFEQGRIGKALAADAEAIKADPFNPQRYREFGAKLTANKQFDQGAVCFRNALVLKPGDVRIEIDLVKALVGAGRCRDARAICEEASGIAVRSGNNRLAQTFDILRDQCHSLAQR
jgi:tetratricopeptide (TPR) repeat protein